MRIPSLRAKAAVALVLALAATPALAIAPQPTDRAAPAGSILRVATAGTTAAPLGLQIFCMRSPADCAPGQDVQVLLTDDTLRLLNSVNRSVNASIRPQLRPTQVWELGARVGDCKDYAMNKRAALIARGFPAGALRLAIGYTARGEGHAVLVVRTSQGDLVLDNLTAQILPYQETGHTLIAMASPNPQRWNAVR